jgi:hypothetical protein
MRPSLCFSSSGIRSWFGSAQRIHCVCQGEAKSEHGDGLEEIDVFGLVGGEKRKVYRDNTAIRLQSMEELLEAGTGEDEKEFLSVFVQFYKEHVEFFVPSNHWIRTQLGQER